MHPVPRRPGRIPQNYDPRRATGTSRCLHGGPSLSPCATAARFSRLFPAFGVDFGHLSESSYLTRVCLDSPPAFWVASYFPFLFLSLYLWSPHGIVGNFWIPSRSCLVIQPHVCTMGFPMFNLLHCYINRSAQFCLFSLFSSASGLNSNR